MLQVTITFTSWQIWRVNAQGSMSKVPSLQKDWKPLLYVMLSLQIVVGGSEIGKTFG